MTKKINFTELVWQCATLRTETKWKIKRQSCVKNPKYKYIQIYRYIHINKQLNYYECEQIIIIIIAINVCHPSLHSVRRHRRCCRRYSLNINVHVYVINNFSIIPRTQHKWNKEYSNKNHQQPVSPPSNKLNKFLTIT